MPRGSIAKRSAKPTPAGLPPTGAAGGDLAGTYPNPTVDGLQGTGISAVAPTTGQTLVYNGTVWIPETVFDSWIDVAADITTAADAYSIILTINVTPTRARPMVATALWSATIAPTSNASFAIFVDGVQRRASDGSLSNVTNSGGVSWSETLSAAAHVVTLRYRNIGGLGAGIFVRPASNPNLESASLRVQLTG